MYTPGAQVNGWLLFAATEMEQPLWRILCHTALYPEHLRLTAEVSLARQDFTDMVAVMEDHIRGRQFFVGNCNGHDLVCAYTLDWANEVRLLDGCPQLLGIERCMLAVRHSVRPEFLKINAFGSVPVRSLDDIRFSVPAKFLAAEDAWRLP